MKNKFLTVFVASFALAISGIANAGLIQTDYLSVGDNQLVLDDSTNLEWLRLDLNIGESLSTVLAKYSGFSLANKTQAHALFNTLFPTVTLPGNELYSDLYGNIYESYDQKWSNLFGRTANTSSATYGFYLADNGDYALMGTWNHVQFYNNPEYFVRFFSEYSNFGTGGDDLGSYMLVRDASNVQDVPEPSTLAIFALSLMGLASRKFKKKA